MRNALLLIALVLVVGAAVYWNGTRRTLAAQGPAETPSTLPASVAQRWPDWKPLTEDQIRAKLTPEQYHVTREAGTEAPFTNKYADNHADGIYHCVVCDLPLYSSKTKFESGTGWPSFWEPIDKNNIIEREDRSYGDVRTEVICARCQSHLGHVFNDGPKLNRSPLLHELGSAEFRPGSEEVIRKRCKKCGGRRARWRISSAA